MDRLCFFSFNVYLDTNYRLKFNNDFKSGSYDKNEHRLYYYCNGGGCTASDTASIRVIPIDSLYQTRTICFGGSVRVGSRTYTATGIYRDTFRNSIGCDSLIVTNLTVIRPGTYAQSFCPGSGISVGSHVYNVSGVYRDTFNGGIPGRDSIVVTTILPADTLVQSTIQVFVQACQCVYQRPLHELVQRIHGRQVQVSRVVQC